MKKKILAVLFMIAMVSCKKSHVSLSTNIVGQWELSRRYGGNILPADTTYQAGNGNILQFNADGSFKQFNKDTVVYSGTFKIDGDQLYLNTNSYNPQANTDKISISGNRLTLMPLMPDVGTIVYNKISN